MIESVILKDFISHRESTLRLAEGVNIFIGANGSGKSSVIDAITYALYGEHTRSEARDLVRYGSPRGAAAVTFSLGGRRLLAERRLTASGTLEHAVLRDLSDGDRTLIAGERRQYGESMTEEVARILGLDYDKMKVAAIVQQGELDAIVRYQPKEMKGLVNSVIGLDRLAEAFENMKQALDSFRATLRNRYRYDDSNLPALQAELGRYREAQRAAAEKVHSLEGEIDALKREEERTRARLAMLEPFRLKVTQLEARRGDLLSYARKRIRELEERVQELNEIIPRAKLNLDIVSNRERLEDALRGLAEKEQDLRAHRDTAATEIGRLEGLRECSGKLEFKNNICPVCGSRVEKISPLFDVDVIDQHLAQLARSVRLAEGELAHLEVEEEDLFRQQRGITEALTWLKVQKIASAEDVVLLEEERSRVRTTFADLPADLGQAEEERLAVDDHSEALVSQILSLRKQLEGFDESEYERLRRDLEERIQPRLTAVRVEQAKHGNELERAEGELRQLGDALTGLEKASKYLDFYEFLRKELYNRDGALALSLRAWALKHIADRASEYIRRFGVGLSRIELKEKKRDVTIECYGTRGILDVESMSGGERVAVALALRFGVADLMGRGRIDFIILDEPTTHLDTERRRSLVRLITEFNTQESATALRQMIVVTHDEEIFQDSEVNAIFKFEMTANGTQVSKLL